MSSNRLRLNSSKTQFIWLGTRQQLAKIAQEFPQFTFSSSVRDLGVTLDQELTFMRHINLLCHDCYYQLRQLRVVFRSLASNAALTLIHSFIVSRLDAKVHTTAANQQASDDTVALVREGANWKIGAQGEG